MPILKIGDIWKVPAEEWICITTNSFVKKDKTLAMGKGIAGEALDRFPELNKILGEFVIRTCGHLGFYGTAIVTKYKLVALQTKYNFKDKSTYELIKKSINKLVSHHLPNNINIAFPGIGYGGLDQMIVWNDCLQDLAAKYIIWKKS